MTIDVEALAQAIGIPAKHVPLLVNSFLEESKQISEQLQATVDENDYEEISKYAHSIKGAAGNLRLTEIYDISMAIEKAACEASDSFDYQAETAKLVSLINGVSI